MPEPPVVDASPLIVLARAHQLELLRLVGDAIVVPEAVAKEVATHSDAAARALAECRWLRQTPDEPVSTTLAAWDLGRGESAVIAWATAHPGSVAVIDDFAARTCAKAFGIPCVGTLGLALRAKALGRVAAARPVVEALRGAGLYLSDGLIAEALSIVGE